MRAPALARAQPDPRPQALIELVEFVNQMKTPFPEALMPEVIAMVSRRWIGGWGGAGGGRGEELLGPFFRLLFFVAPAAEP